MWGTKRKNGNANKRQTKTRNNNPCRNKKENQLSLFGFLRSGSGGRRFEDESLHGELNEQIQVWGIDYSSYCQVRWLIVAFAWSILLTSFEVIVEWRSHYKRPNDHLSDLHQRDDPRWEPLWNRLDRLQEVVEVHHGMHRVVHRHKPQSCWCLSHIRIPAED